MKKKKITQLLAAMSLALIVSMVLPSTIQAADGDDALYDVLTLEEASTKFTEGTTTGTININMGSEEGAGAEFSAYRLLDITTDTDGKMTGFKFNGLFKDFWTNELGFADPAALTEAITSANNNDLLIKDIMDKLYAMKNVTPSTLPAPVKVSGPADDHGIATLSELPMGMYVVLQTKADKAEAGYINSAPILVTLPYEKTTGEGEGATTEYDTVITVTAKNDKPTVEKKIDADDNTTDTTQNYQEEATKAVGSTVEYTTTITVPQYNLSNVSDDNVAKIRLGIEDTLTNQTYRDGSLRVYGFADVNADTSDLEKIQTLLEDGTDKNKDLTDDFTCKISGDSKSFTSYVREYTTLLSEKPEPTVEKPESRWVNKYNKIVFYYQATVTTAAVVGTEQPNKVTYVYQNDVSGTGWDSKKTNDEGEDKPDDEWENPDTPVDEPKDSTKLYIYGLNIFKFEQLAGEGVKNYLAGAKFSMKYQATAEAAKEDMYFIDKGNGIYKFYKTFVPTGTANKTYYEDSTYTTESTTETKFFLETYTCEIDGTEVTVTKDIVSAAGESKEVANGKPNLQVTGLDEGTYTLTETQAPAGYNAAEIPSFTVEAGKETADPLSKLTGKVKGQDDGFYIVNVENKSGLTLPSTGGIGTIVVTAGGILLILGCLTFITTKRSKEKYTE